MLRMLAVAHPGSKTERVALLADDTLAVYVRARPVEGQANRAIEHAIADALDLRDRQVTIVSGQRGRRKIVEIDVSDLTTLRQRLLAHPLRAS